MLSFCNKVLFYASTLFSDESTLVKKLISAAQSRDFDTAKLLREKISADSLYYPFKWACEYNSVEVVELLIPWAFCWKERLRECLSIAASKGHTEIVCILLSCGYLPEYSRNYAIRDAAKNNKMSTVKRLLNEMPVNVYKSIDVITLEWLISINQIESIENQLEAEEIPELAFFWAVSLGRLDIVKGLLRKDKVNMKWGEGALRWAAKQGHSAVIKAVLDDGRVEIDSLDDDTYLMLLEATRQDQLDAFRVIAEHQYPNGMVDVPEKCKSKYLMRMYRKLCKATTKEFLIYHNLKKVKQSSPFYLRSDILNYKVLPFLTADSFGMTKSRKHSSSL